MSHDTVDRVVPVSVPDALSQVYRRLGALHATIAEDDQVDEGLQRRTIDRLMDMLELIEETPRPATSRHRMYALGFFPCEQVRAAEDGRIIVRPLDGGEASGFPAQSEVTLYGRFTAATGSYAIDLMLVDVATGKIFRLSSAEIEVEETERIGDFAVPVRVSFPRPGRYELRFLANGVVLATHPWLASLTSVAQQG